MYPFLINVYYNFTSEGPDIRSFFMEFIDASSTACMQQSVILGKNHQNVGIPFVLSSMFVRSFVGNIMAMIKPKYGSFGTVIATMSFYPMFITSLR